MAAELKRKIVGMVALVILACIAAVTAIAHMSCIVLGEACFRAQLAPEIIIESAMERTWIAPVGTTIVSTLFLVVAVYALSAAKIIGRMPFLRVAIFLISGLCLLRGLGTLPLAMLHPDIMTKFAYVSGVLWFLSGGLCIMGYLLVNGDST